MPSMTTVTLEFAMMDWIEVKSESLVWDTSLSGLLT